MRIIDLVQHPPIDREALIEASRAVSGLVITVEDHYSHGGLGDAVLGTLAEEYAKVTSSLSEGDPHRGKPSELLDRYGIPPVK